MEIVINNQTFNVDVADSFKKKLFGLMGKKDIKKAMFFLNFCNINYYLYFFFIFIFLF